MLELVELLESAGPPRVRYGTGGGTGPPFYQRGSHCFLVNEAHLPDGSCAQSRYYCRASCNASCKAAKMTLLKLWVLPFLHVDGYRALTRTEAVPCVSQNSAAIMLYSTTLACASRSTVHTVHVSRLQYGFFKGIPGSPTPQVAPKICFVELCHQNGK
jgi:hypothetical protein